MTDRRVAKVAGWRRQARRRRASRGPTGTHWKGFLRKPAAWLWGIAVTALGGVLVAALTAGARALPAIVNKSLNPPSQPLVASATFSQPATGPGIAAVLNRPGFCSGFSV